MEMWTIGEVVKRAGVRSSALRYYEEVGVLAPAARVGGQQILLEDPSGNPVELFQPA